jgi:hypothetical protein
MLKRLHEVPVLIGLPVCDIFALCIAMCINPLMLEVENYASAIWNYVSVAGCYIGITLTFIIHVHNLGILFTSKGCWGFAV